MIEKMPKFHGMTIIGFFDQNIAKNNFVLDKNSEGKLIVLKYDSELNSTLVREFDNDEIFKTGFTESNITGTIKRSIGKNSILISNSAKNIIKRLTEKP